MPMCGLCDRNIENRKTGETKMMKASQFHHQQTATEKNKICEWKVGASVSEFV